MFSTKLLRKILDFDAKIGQIRTPPNYYAESTLIFLFTNFPEIIHVLRELFRTTL